MEQVASKNYQIHLIPDMTNFMFSGKVTLLLEAPDAIEALDLNIIDLKISSCAVAQEDDWIECKFETDEEKEELKVFLSQKMIISSFYKRIYHWKPSYSKTCC